MGCRAQQRTLKRSSNKDLSCEMKQKVSLSVQISNNNWMLKETTKEVMRSRPIWDSRHGMV